jgi:hypothetical protein
MAGEAEATEYGEKKAQEVWGRSIEPECRIKYLTEAMIQ